MLNVFEAGRRLMWVWRLLLLVLAIGLLMSHSRPPAGEVLTVLGIFWMIVEAFAMALGWVLRGLMADPEERRR